ncbi:MAG: S8 family serine peptidase, partial [Bdellovibrionales bacterium]|nr:S8 family serine peptidase [Bdellovibrionales bacterium]
LAYVVSPILIGCSAPISTNPMSIEKPLCTASTTLKTVSNRDGAQVFSSNKIQLNQAFTKVSATNDYIATLDMACMRSHKNPVHSAKIRFKNQQPVTFHSSQGVVSAQVSLEGVSDEAELEEIIQSEDCILGLSDNLPMQKLAMPNDTNFSLQTNLTAIGFQSSYDFFNSNLSLQAANRVIIALIDDGINLQHPDLKPNIWVNSKEIFGVPGADDDGNGYVDDIYGYDFVSQTGDPSHKTSNPHGSHVAGLAAAVSNNNLGISGVITKNVKLMALNVFGSGGGTTSAKIDEAIRYAADNGAHVINISLGGQGRSASTLAAIQYAVSKNVTVIAAIGNDGEQLTSSNFYSPGSYAPEVNGMISVAAVNASNVSQICDFSNYSSSLVELSAPGCDSQNSAGLLSTLSGSSYGRHNGTSMATPQVSAAAALAILSIKNRTQVTVTPAVIENVLLSTATAKPSLQTQVKGAKTLSLSSLAMFIDINYPIGSPQPLVCN